MSKELRNANGNANQNDQNQPLLAQKNCFGGFKLFQKEELGSVRAKILENGETIFVLSDVCQILDIGNASEKKRALDDDEVFTIRITEGKSGRGGHTLNVCTEAGLYHAVLVSRKDSAKAFRRWITHEVLPSLRRNGSYVMNQENLDPEELDALRRDLQKLRSDHEELGHQYDALQVEYDELLSDYKDLYDKNKPVLQEKQLIIDPEGFVMLKEAWKPVL